MELWPSVVGGGGFLNAFFAVKEFFGKEQQRNYFHVSKVPGENTLGFVDVACNDRHTLVLFS
jgi:hypothetical protein